MKLVLSFHNTITKLQLYLQSVMSTGQVGSQFNLQSESTQALSNSYMAQPSYSLVELEYSVRPINF